MTRQQDCIHFTAGSNVLPSVWFSPRPPAYSSGDTIQFTFWHQGQSKNPGIQFYSFRIWAQEQMSKSKSGPSVQCPALGGQAVLVVFPSTQSLLGTPFLRASLSPGLQASLFCFIAPSIWFYALCIPQITQNDWSTSTGQPFISTSASLRLTFHSSSSFRERKETVIRSHVLNWKFWVYLTPFWLKWGLHTWSVS